mgnify:CR=1 FL=1
MVHFIEIQDNFKFVFPLLRTNDATLLIESENKIVGTFIAIEPRIIVLAVWDIVDACVSVEVIVLGAGSAFTVLPL